MHVGQPGLFELGAVLQRQLQRRWSVRAAQSELSHQRKRLHDRRRLLLENVPQWALCERFVLHPKRRRLRG